MTERMTDAQLDREIRAFLAWHSDDLAGAPSASEMTERVRGPVRSGGLALTGDDQHRLVLALLLTTLLVLLIASAAIVGGLVPQLGAVLTWSKLDAASLGLTERRLFGGGTARVAWLDDRFVLVDAAPGATLTSDDGLTWDLQQDGSRDHGYHDPLVMDSIASWQNDVVGWDARSNVLRVARPPNEPATAEFEGDVGAVGIGPAGIVVGTHSALEFDAYITSLMGPDWVQRMTSFDFTDGILRIMTDDGRELEIVWAEHGFEPGDVADRGFGWHSLDGAQWTAIPDFPDNVSDIIGVEDGFIARGSAMWHSADGLAWRRLGPFTPGYMVPWKGEVLAVPDQSGRRLFDLWTSGGPRPLANAPELDVSWEAVGTGTLGLVALGTDDTILYSPDGIDWSIAPMPEQMVADAHSRAVPTVAVGERSVVLLVWRDDVYEYSPSLWLGTLER